MELTIFHMDGCPYCHNARRAVEELLEEKSAYGAVRLDWHEETRERELAESYDYYYVPAVFLGGEKLYEAHPGESYEECREKLRGCFERAIG